MKTPKPILKAKKELDLEEKIEWHMGVFRNSVEGTRTYNVSKKLIKRYALQYKKLMGYHYTRNWSNT